jgi:hypothetical protein
MVPMDSLDSTHEPHPRFSVQGPILSVGGDGLKTTWACISACFRQRTPGCVKGCQQAVAETRRTIGTIETEMRDSRFKIPYPEMTVRRKVTSPHFVLFVK